MDVSQGLMAMEQEEQRNIHPFFRRDLSTIVPPHDLPNGNPTCESQDTRRKAPASHNHSHTVSDHSPASQNTPPVSTLEHDPNAGRRKRRRTDKTGNTDDSKPGPPSDETESIDASNTILKLSYAKARSNTSNSSPERSDASDNPRQSEQRASDAPSGFETTKCPEPPRNAEKKSPKQKTIQLNPNGKLLGSPVGSRSDEKPKKKGSKRSKSGAQKDDNRSKLAIIRYAKDDETRERLGKLIDDIINGRKKHRADGGRPAPVPTVKKEMPLKPTHPFFMKKPTNKSDPSTQSSNQDPPANDPAHEKSIGAGVLGNETSKSSAPNAFTKSFTSFKTRPSKSLEPVHPLWPPQHLAHVRGAPSKLARLSDELGHSRKIDQKKSKMAAIRINDKESVLSFEVQGLDRDTPGVLRIPGRHVASGPVLQKAVSKQLSQFTLSPRNKDSLNDICHPAVSKLHSSITSSMTAFDRGGYDSLQWGQKYAPNSAKEVLQATKEAPMLRDWLKHLMISAVDTGKSSKDTEKAQQKSDNRKRKKRKKSEMLDGFIVSSGDEASEMGEVTGSDDELAGDVTVSSKKTLIRSGDMTIDSKPDRGRMSNAILLSGPSGCGKTASVYAVAKELDFEVFEINSGNRRSARDILERVGDMTRNHLVHNLNGGEERPSCQPSDSNLSDVAPEDVKQNKLMGFFKSTTTKEPKKDIKAQRKQTEKETDQKRSRSQKQSFILLEEADILFEEDRQFWSGVLTLINQSKRPIIITCNDESLIPLQDISFHAILRYRAPPQPLAVDYLLLLAANEGHLLKREAIDDLYTSTGKDLRKSITELDFWCQMAIGSEKSGLDWMINRWPRGSDVDQQGDQLKVISLNTYERFMGWFSRDMLMSNSVDQEVEPQRESLCWWQLSLQDSESMADSSRAASQHSPASSNLEHLGKLRHQSDFMDMRSVLDLLSSDCSLDPLMDDVDTSIPQILDKQRANYIEGYPLLTADLVPDYSSLPATIGSTFQVLLGRVSRPHHQTTAEGSQAAKVLVNATRPKNRGPGRHDFARAFEPVMKANYSFPPPTGRLAASFENGLKPITEDLGPYIRAIMSFDLRLEQHRLQLSGLLSHSGQGAKRERKTRASRAALEGGSKAETRKERWFPADSNPALILATGKKEWQDVLIQGGHFTMACAEGVSSRELSEAGAESSGDGGI